MKVVALIPARIGSTRFPGKMLAAIAGKPLVVRTYESAVQTGLFTKVVVVTDSDDIEAAIKAIGGDVLRSNTEHATGTDRIAEVAGDIDADIIINIQGDEPFMEKEPLAILIDLFKEDTELPAASLVLPTKDIDVVRNPNRVKVLLNENNFAIYFSRSPVPYLRDKTIDIEYYIHVGIYAFRKDVLLRFAGLSPMLLERAEQLECNRFIEYNIPIKLAVTNHVSIAVDVEDDIKLAEEYLIRNKMN